MTTPILLLLVGALIVACAGSLVLVVTRRAGPGAVIGAVLLGSAALAVVVFSLAPALRLSSTTPIHHPVHWNERGSATGPVRAASGQPALPGTQQMLHR